MSMVSLLYYLTTSPFIPRLPLVFRGRIISSKSDMCSSSRSLRMPKADLKDMPLYVLLPNKVPTALSMG